MTGLTNRPSVRFIDTGAPLETPITIVLHYLRLQNDDNPDVMRARG